jgi:alkylated DNA repair dioxygenase AlkB
MQQQADLFARSLPRGLVYRPDFISPAEEQELLAVIQALPLAQARYRQYTARRRTVNFGSSYDFTHRVALDAPPIPAFLLSLRAKVAAWAAVLEEHFVQALVAEYSPGTPLGWHRDVPEFEVICGVSLAGPARLRFRPYPWSIEKKREVFALDVEPRSAYVLRDEARWAWQHSVPPTKALRYSITFRTRRGRAGAAEGTQS